MKRLVLAAAISWAGSAAAGDLSKYSSDLGKAPPGRIYHYLRSNTDGSEPERVSVFHRDATRLEVYKRVAKCTNAALVTAELDSVAPIAVKLTGGRLQPEAKHVEFAWLDYDRATRRITARVAPPGQTPEVKTLTLGGEPFHLFDFDLASLTVVTPRLTHPRAGFDFEMPLVWLGAGGWTLRNLGRAEAVFEREEAYAGRPALRFRVEGPALAGRGGPLWLDRADGHVLGAAWGVPNHAEYKDFKLELTAIDDGGAAAWTALLRAHYEGCPAK